MFHVFVILYFTVILLNSSTLVMCNFKTIGVEWNIICPAFSYNCKKDDPIFSINWSQSDNDLKQER